MNKLCYRLGNDSNDSQYIPINRSKSMNIVRNEQRQKFSLNTNNINEEIGNNKLKYVYGYLDGEKIDCPLDTSSEKRRLL